jgi:pimeloyl-ACP methyl ester carboxylesterase
MDGYTKIVKSWVEKNAAPGSEYFEWNESARLRDYIAAVPAGEPINLYGHSFGGDTAAYAALTSVRTIDSLNTLDPVSPLAPDLKRLRCKVGTWNNANAKPSAKNRDDYIASAGGKWGDRPAGIASSHVDVNVNHGDFGGLMAGLVRSSPSSKCEC